MEYQYKQSLCTFCKKTGARVVISKPLKVPFSKNVQWCKDLFGIIYKDPVPKGKERLLAGLGDFQRNIKKRWCQHYQIFVKERASHLSIAWLRFSDEIKRYIRTPKGNRKVARQKKLEKLDLVESETVLWPISLKKDDRTVDGNAVQGRD